MQTFVAIGAVSGLVLSIQLVLSLIGGDMDGLEADMDLADGGEGGASGILSIRTIGAFSPVLLTGASMTEAGLGWESRPLFRPWWVRLLAMVFTSWPICTVFGRKERWTIRMQLAKSGRSTARPPRTEKGLVKSVMVQGRLKIVQSVTDQKKIGNRVAVRITELVDEQTILVEPLENESKTKS